jgi:hypothetical protein
MVVFVVMVDVLTALTDTLVGIAIFLHVHLQDVLTILIVVNTEHVEMVDVYVLIIGQVNIVIAHQDLQRDVRMIFIAQMVDTVVMVYVYVKMDGWANGVKQILLYHQMVVIIMLIVMVKVHV